MGTRTTDHPRSRGVYVTKAVRSARSAGSSPLARGLLKPFSAVGWTVGIIPARAGFTVVCYHQDQSSWDHPRSRGVYWGLRDPAGASGGSSPLARGLRRQHDPPTAPSRIIPARAGFTREVGAPAAQVGRIIPARAGFTHSDRQVPDDHRDHPRSRGVYVTGPHPRIRVVGSSPLARGLPKRRLTLRVTDRDHPRSRGVYKPYVEIALSQPGSSPLARGLRGSCPDKLTSDRIIPARAGFTAQTCLRWTSTWDHPRSRGVYPVGIRPYFLARGSSPLARGLLLVARILALRHGIIPARAGFTADFARPNAGNMDHPRSRGVYSSATVLVAKISGSSPLARGLQSYRLNADACGGIIPARAGFTAGRSLAQQASQDHPRSRGVYAGAIARIAPIVGSSPLARGLQQSATLTAVAAGIIPARAGFTSP